MYHLNFCAGPASLPKHIYKSLSRTILDYQKTGMSFLSISHRDKIFERINFNIKKYLKLLLTLPDSYEILLMPAGASAQFSAVPMNLKQLGKALYIKSGYWSSAAIQEAKKFIEVDVIEGVDVVIDKAIRQPYDYVHYTENETIDGIMWHSLPNTSYPLVCDISSSFLSKPIEIPKYSIIYAGAQKNIGLPGVTVVLTKKKLIESVKENSIPSVLSYKSMQQTNSLYNTPDTFSWLAMELVLADLIKQGGLEEVAKKNAKKSALLYEAIDQSGIFNNNVLPKNRSSMNVVFQLPNDQLTSEFLAFVDSQGIYGVAGHRSIGGIRVSLYNSVELEAVEKLVAVMCEFEDINRNVKYS